MLFALKSSIPLGLRLNVSPRDIFLYHLTLPPLTQCHITLCDYLSIHITIWFMSVSLFIIISFLPHLTLPLCSNFSILNRALPTGSLQQFNTYINVYETAMEMVSPRSFIPLFICVCFLICEMEIITVHTSQGDWELKKIHVFKVFTLYLAYDKHLINIIIILLIFC